MSNIAVLETLNAQLPEPVRKRGIEHAQWMALSKSLYPGAAGESILMVWDYCRARGLDPLKKPCHIVPMRVKDAKTGNYEWRDVVLPGIYELRTTAQRTRQYLGHSRPEYGPTIEALGVEAPEWCELVIYRWHSESKQKIEFPVRVYLRECIGTTKDRKTGVISANERWSKAPVQMLTKCTEAAGLREAFPDELGGSMSAEEMDGQSSMIDVATRAKPEPARTTLAEIKAAADLVPDPEPHPDQQHEPALQGFHALSADEVQQGIEAAKEVDQIHEAMDLIRHLPEIEQPALKKAAVAKLASMMDQ